MTGANVAYGSPRGDIGNDNDDIISLQHELSEEEQRKNNNDDKLTAEEQRIVNEEMAKVKPRTADLTDNDRLILERERALVKLITPDVEKDETTRNNKLFCPGTNSNI